MGKTMGIVWLGLTMGNFTYAALRSQQWGSALEHSFYEGVALAALYITLWLSGRAV